MKYIALGLLILSSGMAFGDMAQTKKEAVEFKSALAALPKDSRTTAFVNAVNNLRASIDAISEEKDPLKKVALIKDQGEQLVARGKDLAMAVKDLPIPESAKTVLKKAMETGQFQAFKQELMTFKENMLKIKQEKDPKKKLAMLKAEGERLVSKGKGIIGKLKKRGLGLLSRN